MEKFFKKIGVNLIVPIIFIILALVFFINYDQSRNKVLIIQSYDPELSWTRRNNEGIDSVLNNYENIKVKRVYLNTKNHFRESEKRAAALEARKLIASYKPDVIIASNDDAQLYVTNYYYNQSEKFVFSGLNDETIAENFKSSNNITGVLERLPLNGLRDMITELVKDKNLGRPIKVVHIACITHTAKQDDEYIQNFKQWGDIRVQPSRLVQVFDEWKKAVLDANQDCDFILISNYRQIAISSDNPTLVTGKEIMEWTVANSKIPVIGLKDIAVEDGGPLAIFASSTEQGAEAAAMAVNIIQNKLLPTENNVPMKYPRQFIVSMNPKVMEKFGLKLPDVYAAAARASKTYFE